MDKASKAKAYPAFAKLLGKYNMAGPTIAFMIPNIAAVIVPPVSCNGSTSESLSS